MLLHLVGGEHHRRGADPQHTIFIRLCDENVPVGGVRLFLMTFCVSSFAALVKHAGYVLVFPPSWRENMIGNVLLSFFLPGVCFLKNHYAAKGTP